MGLKQEKWNNKCMLVQGFIWLATRRDLSGEWSQAGGILRVSMNGPWFDAIPKEAWPDEELAHADILKVPCTRLGQAV